MGTAQTGVVGCFYRIESRLVIYDVKRFRELRALTEVNITFTRNYHAAVSGLAYALRWGSFFCMTVVDVVNNSNNVECTWLEAHDAECHL